MNQREGERGNRGEYRSQSWVENTNMTECTQEIGYLQSINSDKHLPQSPFAVFFRSRHFPFYVSYLSTHVSNVHFKPVSRTLGGTVET